MQSRMDKYKDTQDEQETRISRNQKIYKQIDDKDIENLNLEGNISVIDTNVNELDIDKLKNLLNERYETEHNPKKIDDVNSDIDDIDKEVTKEYDLKKVLDNAHKNRINDYDRDRFQKLKKTQFEILNSLNIENKKNKDEESLTREETDLINMIKTVTENGDKVDAGKDDLFEDLKGNCDTEVLEPINIDENENFTGKKPTIVEELEKTKRLSRKELDDEIDKITSKLDEVIEKVKENTSPISKTEEMSNSFYTGSLGINEKDMDKFSDLEKEMGGGSIVIKILIIILVIITLAIIVYILNKYLNLGLF